MSTIVSAPHLKSCVCLVFQVTFVGGRGGSKTIQAIMNSQTLSICASLMILICGLIQTAFPCSPDPNKPHRSLTELAILAPVVLVANVVNISVPARIQMFTRYSACLNVRQVIKGDQFNVPETFCTEDFGTEAMCLVNIFTGSSYVFFLNSDLKARYDSHFSAAIPANNLTINLAQRGFCNSSQVNDSTCVPPKITDPPKRWVLGKEGKNLLLRCSVSGTKPYVVTWYFNGRKNSMPMRSIVGYDGSLSLTAVTQSNRGKYTCVVQNAAGMASQDRHVLVEIKPCGDFMMVNKRSHIHSPNFPNEYPPDKSCAWRLCPPNGKRLKFIFHVFFLDRSDAILIDNECDRTLDSWRRYCGTTSPGEFISSCPSECVQVRLVSSIKMRNSVPFFGMNFSVEPTSKNATPKFDVMMHYCESDFVLKGRFIEWDKWSSNAIRIHSMESFKKPYEGNKTFTLHYKTVDFHGCYEHLNFMNDHYFFGLVERKKFKIKLSVPDDSQQKAIIFKEKLQEYKNNDSLCNPSK